MFTIKEAVSRFEKETRMYIPTGFPELDVMLGGGFTEGLYVIGGGSGVGKSALALQMASFIAKVRPVLYVTLEMPASELVARLVSGLSYSFQAADSAAGPMSITDAFQHKPAEILQQISLLHLHILENDGQVNPNTIKDAAESVIKDCGRVPVTVIDYFQILSSMTSGLMSDKQKNDMNIMALKCLAKNLKTTVLVLSSINRMSYGQAVELQSMKETGGIEFTADCVIGITPYGLTGDKNKDCALTHTNNELAVAGKSIRVQTELLKNRFGMKGNFLFDYYPKYNVFLPAGQDDDKTRQKNGTRGRLL